MDAGFAQLKASKQREEERHRLERIYMRPDSSNS
jgi:hypothetical protein